MIKQLFNKKLHELLLSKDELVKKGRKVSAKVEILERKIEKNEEKQRIYTARCEPQDLIERGNALAVLIEKNLTELETLQREIHEKKLESIPPVVAKEFEDLKAEKEAWELERNKIALKVQKIKDRAIPIIQKEMKPFLAEYEDVSTAEVKGEKIIVSTFSHLEDWKKLFAEKNKNVA